MSLLEKKKDIIKKTLRSLVLSAASGLTPSKLLQDYECVVGEQLPLRQLGYTSLIAFAQDMPDVLRIMYSGRSIVFYGVADESTKHIQSMVRKQRKPKPYAALQKDTPPKKVARRFIPKPRISNPVNRSFASAYIRENVCKVLKSLSNGIGLNLFPDIYQQITKNVLSVESLGFKSITDFFLSMPDIARLDYGRLTRSGNNLYVHPSKELAALFSKTNNLAQNENKSNVKTPEEKPKPVQHMAKETDVKQLGQATTPEFCIDTSSSSEDGFTDSDNDDMLSLPHNDSRKTKYDAPLLTSIKDEILQLLEEAPAGIWAIRLSSMYKKKFDKDLKLKEIGYFSVVELMSTMADKVDISRHDALGDWMLMLRSKKPPVIEDEDSEVEVNISQRIMDILKPGPVTIKELTWIYEQKFHEKLPKQRAQLVELLLDVPEISIRHYKGEVIIALESLSDAAKHKKNVVGRPPDACGGDICYMSPSLPDKIGGYIDVFLSEITAPGNFCVQICGKTTTGVLDEIMDKLEQFYCSERSDLYKVPENMVKIGLVCAAIFMEDNNWHRAIILRVVDPEHVDVLYVDYGSVCNIHIEYVRLLHATFLQLPAQMIAARLADVQPVGDQWTAKSREFLLDMCRDKPIVAYVKSIKDRVLSLYLCDTSQGDVDIHINDHIIHTGHAVFCPDDMSAEDMAVFKQFVKQDKEDERKPLTFKVAVPAINEEDAQNVEPQTDVQIHPNTSNNSTHSKYDQELSEIDDLPPLSQDNYFLPVNNHSNGNAEPYSYQNMKETDTLNSAQERKSCTQPKIVVDDYKEQVHFAKRHCLANRGMEFHIIFYNGQVYMTSADISALLNKSRDVLHGLLMMRSMNYSERVIGNNAKNEPLFNDLVKTKVRGILDEGNCKPIVCLYHAKDVPEILNNFTISRETVEEVQTVVDSFDKYDSYWWSSNSPVLKSEPSSSKMREKVNSSSKNTATKQDLCLEGLSLESLHLLKKEYWDQRQNVIKEMVLRGGNAEIVARLKQMEDAIRNITATIQSHDNASELENKKQTVALFDQYWMIDQVLFKPNEAEKEELSLVEGDKCNVESNLAGSLHGRCEVKKTENSISEELAAKDDSESENELMYIPNPNEKSMMNDVKINWNEVLKTKLDVNSPEFVPKSQIVTTSMPTKSIVHKNILTQPRVSFVSSGLSDQVSIFSPQTSQPVNQQTSFYCVNQSPIFVQNQIFVQDQSPVHSNIQFLR